jgi:hypothetical protein
MILFTIISNYLIHSGLIRTDFEFIRKYAHCHTAALCHAHCRTAAHCCKHCHTLLSTHYSVAELYGLVDLLLSVQRFQSVLSVLISGGPSLPKVPFLGRAPPPPAPARPPPPPGPYAPQPAGHTQHFRPRPFPSIT